MKNLYQAAACAAVLMLCSCQGPGKQLGEVPPIPDVPAVADVSEAQQAGRVLIGQNTPVVGTLAPSSQRTESARAPTRPETGSIANAEPDWRPGGALRQGAVHMARIIGTEDEQEVTQVADVRQGGSPGELSPVAAAYDLFPVRQADDEPFQVPEVSEEPLLTGEAPPVNRFDINLATALQLAGGNNLQIALAQERIREAFARQEGADVLWIPTIAAGVGYNDHSGQIQDTMGDVIEVNRDSIFVGGGAGVGSSPLTGGSGGPARFFVDLSLVDAYFEPLAARQLVRQANTDSSSVFNDTLLDVTLAYLELVRAQGVVAIAEEAVKNADALRRLTENYARAGTALEADANRTRVDFRERQRILSEAKERARVISAELARLLRLDQNVVLYAVETLPVPITVVSEDLPLATLIAQGQMMRPEVARQQALFAETSQRVRQEELRPWVPNVHMGMSTGGFAGGPGSQFTNWSGRYDFDVLAIWELENLGLGNRARQRERRSQNRQATLQYHATRDRVAAEVTQAYQQVQHRREQIELARAQIESAAEALPQNFNGIFGGELRSIEALQAISALADARSRYLSAIIGYNQAQFALLRAIGQPPNSTAGPSQARRPVPPPAVPPSAPE